MDILADILASLPNPAAAAPPVNPPAAPAAGTLPAAAAAGKPPVTPPVTPAAGSPPTEGEETPPKPTGKTIHKHGEQFRQTFGERKA